mmetsp:Transcript_15457/g.23992  ORF Transcript_15457/g.23992 Transcript_15457/m.23992 type:complete len:407 (+) Transcript_15457:110-1330(+)|eukprot:CAMPEP_0196821978 /NCGR_PEP_ID=MMETSP1362-20130617/81723_1 /TAXON_ID=163516 /ORGANISM="Leptocylindrus danicus, Strain CCMP1856" /LENGTH=406 /DNA_ID=CAMNT_0042201383 /DNA_START=93 /DNA_END=1313 /DNA_ORIENTATION=+
MSSSNGTENTNTDTTKVAAEAAATTEEESEATAPPSGWSLTTTANAGSTRTNSAEYDEWFSRSAAVNAGVNALHQVKRKRVGLHDLDLSSPPNKSGGEEEEEASVNESEEASVEEDDDDDDDDDSTSVPSLPDTKANDTWMEKFEELKQFRKIHGNFLVPQSDRSLGSWVNTVRQQYKFYMEGKKSYITQHKIDMLNNIGFAWEASTNKWMMKFEELCRYKQAHGDCLVPQNYKSSEWEYSGIVSTNVSVNANVNVVNPKNNPKAAGTTAYGQTKSALGSWVMTQRKYYRLLLEGKKSYLTQEKVDLLNGIGFVWTVRKTGDERNKKKKPKVVKDKEKEGKTPVVKANASATKKAKKTKSGKGQDAHQHGKQQRGTTMWGGASSAKEDDDAKPGSGKDDFVEGVKV